MLSLIGYINLLLLIKAICSTTCQVGLLNVNGYYNSLLSFIDVAVGEGFISQTARRIIVSSPSAKELVRKLEVVYHIIK